MHLEFWFGAATVVFRLQGPNYPSLHAGFQAFYAKTHPRNSVSAKAHLKTLKLSKITEKLANLAEKLNGPLAYFYS